MEIPSEPQKSLGLRGLDPDYQNHIRADLLLVVFPGAAVALEGLRDPHDAPGCCQNAQQRRITMNESIFEFVLFFCFSQVALWSFAGIWWEVAPPWLLPDFSRRP